MKRAITGLMTIVVVLSMVCVSQGAVVFQMDFNDTDGNQSLLDRGATGVTGTFTGNATYSTTVPSVNRGGYSGSFDGSSGAADFGDIDALDGLTTMTITAWIRMTSAGQNGGGRIVNKRSSNGPELYYNSELEFVANTSPVANGGGAIGFGGWKFVAVTYDGSTATFYTGDGTTLSEADADPTANGALTANANALLIGNHSGGARTFDGLIDNLRIYNSIEDAASLTNIMQFDDTVVELINDDFSSSTAVIDSRFNKGEIDTDTWRGNGAWSVSGEALTTAATAGQSTHLINSVSSTDTSLTKVTLSFDYSVGAGSTLYFYSTLFTGEAAASMAARTSKVDGTYWANDFSQGWSSFIGFSGPEYNLGGGSTTTVSTGNAVTSFVGGTSGTFSQTYDISGFGGGDFSIADVSHVLAVFTVNADAAGDGAISIDNFNMTATAPAKGTVISIQ
jgi:hypothetical protein